ncbi:hypothetical protein FOB82_03155 [Corynebacterium xerosis]|uniref:Uncharacterized protein n=1 Tax=Corynebacterium xerosis TaxID=1725 RepID=A0A6B8TEW8_9CORY|nr:hypothetical protein [Corynebacterium xerosis]QGS34094.1 hypothetical protein FOB82_03155 [Corynebacterium xerosis]
MTEVHVIFTNYGDDYGWSIASPQCPGIAGGRATLQESIELAPELLYAAGLTEQPDKFYAHIELGVEDPDGREYLLRLQNDDDPGRYATRRAGFAALYTLVVGGHLTDDDRANEPRLVTGERLMIATLASDTLAVCLDQIDGDSAVFTQFDGHKSMRSVPFVEGKVPGRRSWTTEELELARHDTFDSIYDRLTSAELEAIIREETEIPEAEPPSGRIDEILEVPADANLRRLLSA